MTFDTIIIITLLIISFIFTIYNYYKSYAIYNKYNKMKKYIDSMDINEINMMLKYLSTKVIIPNWYHKKDIESLLLNNVGVDDIMFNYIIKLYKNLRPVTDDMFKNWVLDNFEFDNYSSDSDDEYNSQTLNFDEISGMKLDRPLVIITNDRKIEITKLDHLKVFMIKNNKNKKFLELYSSMLSSFDYNHMLKWYEKKYIKI
jgi:hypothetical protein